MGSRIEGADSVYAAAELWVERALRRDDSLFTPGESIWSSRLVDPAKRDVSMTGTC